VKARLIYSLLLLVAVSLVYKLFFLKTEHNTVSNSEQKISIPEKQPEKPVFNDYQAKKLPPVQATAFDYSDVKNTAEKKQKFFDILRPLIENQNQIIRDNRKRIQFARKHNTDHDWLAAIAEEHKLDWDRENPDWDRLLFHIDTVPAELVMTQAANESAWGLSRFAQKGNNLFGQWCFSKGCGLVPAQRNKGSKHEVRKFDSINDSIASYMHNINTSRAYRDLRKVRAEQRSRGEALDAMTLAGGLKKYSSRGMAYVREIRSMIKTNLALMQKESPNIN